MKRPFLLSIVLSALLCAWIFSGAAFKSKGQGLILTPVPRAEVLQTVIIQTQVAKNVTRTISLPAVTEPARQATISAEIEGHIIEVNDGRGAYVDEGTILVRINMRDKKQQLGRAQADFKVESDNLKRVTALHEQRVVSEAQSSQVKADYEEARASLADAKFLFEATMVRAPFPGVLEERYIDLGDFVSLGDEIALILDATQYIVTGAVSEFEVDEINVGGRGEATLIDGKRVEGVIRYKSRVADDETRTYAVELLIATDGKNLPAMGASTMLHIPVGESEVHEVAPSLLNLNQAGEIGVKIVDLQNVVRFTPVEIAKSNATTTWVSGLPKSARIINVGHGFVRDGQEVLIEELSVGEIASSMNSSATGG